MLWPNVGEVFKVFFVNICILATFVYIINRFRPVNKCVQNNQRGICFHCALTYAMAAMAVMHFPIAIDTGIFLDLRLVPLTLSGFYGGPLTGFAASFLVATYRMFLGGIGAIPGAAACILAGPAAAAVSWLCRRWYLNRASWPWLLLAGSINLLLLFFAVKTIIPAYAPKFAGLWLPVWILMLASIFILSVIVEDNIASQNYHRKIEVLAQTDGLTGLANHWYFQKQLITWMCNGQCQPCSLIMLDIDHFKKYNDAFGHPAGDQLLQELAKILQATVRYGDFIARYGGEEFAILLPYTTKSAAVEIAERILGAVRVYSFAGRGPASGGRITVSAGVATYPDDAADNRELVGKADKALYLAKSLGRDRVEAFRRDAKGRR